MNPSVDAGILPDWRRNIPRPVYASLERVLPDEPWFEVYHVPPGVFALYEPRQFQEVISFLVTGRERAVLLDTGMGIASIRNVVSRLTALPVTVLNTHAHADHVGGNAEFADIHMVDTEFTRVRARGIREAWVQDWVRPPNVHGPMPDNFDADSFEIAPFTITQFVRDGEVIDLGGRRLHVIHTPGHTPDSICVHDPENRLLFTGDSYYPGQIYLFVPETDLPAYERSIARIAALPDVDLLLPSHNEPVAHPDVLPRLLEAAKRVQSGTLPFTALDDLREYFFDGFSMLLPK